jgi:hypothetical protein
MLDGIHFDAFARRQGISRVSASDMACVATALLVTPSRAASAPTAGTLFARIISQLKTNF